jgi:3,4-dihydroxy-2-butanone 4-phosphate synthase
LDKKNFISFKKKKGRTSIIAITNKSTAELNAVVRKEGGFFCLVTTDKKEHKYKMPWIIYKNKWMMKRLTVDGWSRVG